MSRYVLSQSWTSRTGFALPINSVLNLRPHQLPFYMSGASISCKRTSQFVEPKKTYAGPPSHSSAHGHTAHSALALPFTLGHWKGPKQLSGSLLLFDSTSVLCASQCHGLYGLADMLT